MASIIDIFTPKGAKLLLPGEKFYKLWGEKENVALSLTRVKCLDDLYKIYLWLIIYFCALIYDRVCNLINVGIFRISISNCGVPLSPGIGTTVFWIIHRFVALVSIRGRTRSVSLPAPRNLAYHQILICLRSTHPTLPSQHFSYIYNGSVTLPPFWIFLLSAVAHKSLLSLRLFWLWQHQHLCIGRVSLGFLMCVYVLVCQFQVETSWSHYAILIFSS